MRVAGQPGREDVLELSMLTMQQQGTAAVDISWQKSPPDS